VSPLPGVIYEEQDAAGTTGPPLDTATTFIAGEAERGPVGKAVAARAPSAYATNFGGSWASGYLDDAAVILPVEGAAGMYFSRAVGPAAKPASAKLVDGASANTLEVIAANPEGDEDPGAWANGMKAKVTLAGSAVTLEVIFGGVVVEQFSGSRTEAINWAKSSSYIRLKDLGAGDPKTQEVTLSGGTDDRVNITDTHRAASLDAFTSALGPGQILYPGATTAAMWKSLLEAGLNRNRRAILDGADTHTVATLTGACATARALGLPAHYGAVMGPWAVGPGSAAGTTKTVPYSIIQAGLCARRDLATVDGTLGIGNPNSPASGIHEDAGVSRWATGLSQSAWTDSERETLNNAGYNVVREIYGRVVTYGYRTLANPVTEKTDLFFNNSRLDMAIIAASKAVAEEFNLRDVVLNGKTSTLSDYKAALIGRVLLPYWEVGALYGASSEEAFSVDTSDAVNPPKQLAEGIVLAVERAKRGPLAEQTKLIYVKEELS
jgi:hypothetical protein